MKTTAARRGACAAALLAAVAGCASIPDGPSAMALPGTGRSFAQFRADDDACRRHADERIGGQTAQKSANDTVAGGAVAGAAVGAVAGAAIGGSRGAGVGAGTGVVVGSAVGSGSAAGSARDAQRRYDQAYVQCMYASGHKVPVVEGFRPVPAASTPVSRDGRATGAPPPPPGAPPAPPPATSSPASPAPPPGAPPPPPPSWRS